jgi:pimeloyl-ACP methyl ester carboxylesterase
MRTLFPKLGDVSFKDLHRLEVPVFLLLGRQDYTAPSPIAAAWLDQLDAPKKVGIWFEHSAHLHMLEEPGRVFMTRVNDVRPLAD